MKKIAKVNWDEVPKNGMVLNGFTKVDNLLAREIMNRCSISAYALYVTLLSHRDTNSGKCFPSQKVLGLEMGMADRTLRNYMTDLQNNGFIKVDSGCVGVASTYYFPREQFYTFGEGVCAVRGRKGSLKKVGKATKKVKE